MEAGCCLSLGTHDAQTSCLLPKLSQDGILLKVGMGGFICVPCAYSFIPQTTESLGFLYMFTLASVADPRLFDPRVCDDKTYIPKVGMEQTWDYLLLLVRLGKQNLVISFIFVRVYSLATVEWKEFLPGSSLSHLGH